MSAYPGDPNAAHPAPGTPTALDPRDLVHALTSDECLALEPKIIGFRGIG